VERRNERDYKPRYYPPLTDNSILFFIACYKTVLIMHISKKNRELIKKMFDGKCAYTGTELQLDWQIDHVEAVRRNWWLSNSAMLERNHKLENMMPSQRIVNHYKHSMNLEQFRSFMKDFHIRISKLPKSIKSEKTIKRKAYMLEIAKLFDITTDKAFSGRFYFETLS
jgi:hypothetical protein